MLVIDRAWVRRIEAFSQRHNALRQRLFEALPGNPLSAAHRHFAGPEGEALALAVAAFASLDWYNRATGFHAGMAGEIEAFDAWHREHGTAPLIELPAGEADGALKRALHAHGFAVTSTAVHWIAPLAALEDHGPLPGVTVRPVESAADRDAFVHVQAEGWGMEAGGARSAHERANTAMPDLDGWTCLLAEVGGEAAGIGVLIMEDGLAYLSEGAVAPAFRGKGCQTALIRERIAIARQAGAEHIWVQATFGGTSARNLQRHGFQAGYPLHKYTRLETERP